MAELTKYFRTGYAVQINYTINSQSIANNTTNVTVKAQLVSSGSLYTIVSNTTKNGTLSINGKDYSFTFTAGLSGGQTKTLYTKTLDIPHNSNGTKTLSLGISLDLNVTLTGVYWSTVTHSDSVALSTIPRTSSMSLSTTSAYVGGSYVIVGISSASESFTHKVYCKIGSYNEQINVGSESSVSIPFIPDLSIANQITNSTSGSATIEVQTYSGKTKLGSVSKSITLQLPGNMVPTISGFTATKVAAGAATSYGYVKGLSKCILSMGTVNGSYGSSIVSYSISGGGFSSTSNSLTTGILNTAGNITFTAKVTDSRGRTATATVPITVYDYAIPSIGTFTAKRCDSDGTVVDNGTYLSIGTTYSFSSVNNQNTVTTSVQYKKSTTTIWSPGVAVTSGVAKIIGGGEVTTDSSYDVIITVSDNFNSISKTLVVPTAYAIIDILKGGKGIAIGKIAEFDNVIDINMNTKFRGITTSGFGQNAGNIGTDADFNNYLTEGEHGVGTTSSTGIINAPYSGTIFGKLIVKVNNGGTHNNSDNWIWQHFIDTSGRYYRRRKVNSGGWTNWYIAYDSNNKPLASDVGAFAKSDWDYSKGSNGYCKLPTGIIIQWGSALITPTAAGTIMSQLITFPITFPSSCRSVQVSPNSAVPDKLTSSAGDITASNFYIYMTRTNTTATTYYWFAIGY